jgi:hypothetical protein
MVLRIEDILRTSWVVVAYYPAGYDKEGTAVAFEKTSHQANELVTPFPFNVPAAYFGSAVPAYFLSPKRSVTIIRIRAVFN